MPFPPSVANERPAPSPGALPRGQHALPPEEVAAEHRQRLLAAAVQLAAEQGCRSLTVADVTRRARVSRGAFYAVFPNLFACLETAFREEAQRLAAVARDAWSAARSDRLTAMIGAGLQAIDDDPAAARFVFVEFPTMGVEAAEARARLLPGLAAQWSEATARARVDLRLLAVLGAVQKIVAARLRLPEPPPMVELADDLRTWVRTYLVSSPARVRTRGRARSSYHAVTAPATRPPLRPLPPGPRARESPAVAEDQRERILIAMADAIAEHGYARTSIREIVGRARVSRQTFYAHFTDKHACFRAAFRLGTQRTIGASWAGYSSAPEGAWAEGVLAGLHAYLVYLGRESGFARLGFVEAIAAGHDTAIAFDQGVDAFAMFLAPSYELDPRTATLPRLCSEAIAGAICELAVQRVLAGRAHELPSLLPEVAHLALTPFLGATPTHRAITAWMRTPPATATPAPPAAPAP